MQLVFVEIMDVSNSKVFETQRGKKCVAINNFEFSEFRENKDKSKVIRTMLVVY